MNYSFTKRNSRFLTILLVLTLLVTMLTGCFGGSKEPETTDPTGNDVPPGLVEVKEPETTAPTETEPEIDGNSAVVIGEQVNVLSSPGAAGKVIGHLDQGTVVEILRTEHALGVNYALTSTGWVIADFLDFNYDPEFESTDTPAANNPDSNNDSNTSTGTNTSIKGVVNATQLFIRKEPSKDADSVGSYVKGDVVTILETSNGWGRTNQGWISMQYVTTTSENDVTNNDNNQNNNNNNNNNNNQNNNTNTANIKAVVTGSELNIRKEPSINGERVGSYTYGARISILETSNGWGRTDKGWISMQYVYQDGTTGTNTAKGIVIGNGLNIRTGPGTNYDSNGSYGFGDRVNILEQITIGDTKWACTNKGWISMQYVYVDGTTGEGAGDGVVSVDGLYIRSGPGTGYEAVGSYEINDEIKILAQFTYDGVAWGCTNKGWVCMDYVTMG